MQGSHLISGDVCFEVKLQCLLEHQIWPNRLSHCSCSLFLSAVSYAMLTDSHTCLSVKTIFPTTAHLGGS